MNLTRRMWLTCAVVLVLGTGQAFAGGGGAKKSSKIHVTNNSSLTVGVAVDGSAAALAAAIGDKSVSEFKAAGGRILNPGDTTTFSVTAGDHTVVAADSNFVESGGSPLTVHVNKGATKGVLVNDDGAGATNIIDP